MMMFLSVIETPQDKSRFQQLYDKYLNLVMWISMQKLNNTTLAEEAVQDTFMYIAKNFSKVGDIDSEATKNYIATIANGFAINKYNKENKSDSVFYDDTYKNINESDFESYSLVELKSAINALSDENKNYFYLKYVYGCSSREIAKMYGISPELVRKRLQLAKQKIRNYLTESENDENG